MIASHAGFATEPPLIQVDLPEHEPVMLEPTARLEFEPIDEASGLVKSRQWADLFWTHNDSGDDARIFPINGNGLIVKPEWMQDYQGIEIPNAVNVDWESIATDDAGNLIIGDIGNNSNTRRDLTVYFVPEPYPSETVITGAQRQISFYYPDQDSLPSSVKNFDAEAMFWKNGKLYILTKHRSDTYTKLYRFDEMEPFKSNPLTLVGYFDIQNMVSGADISLDGTRLAVLTYDAIWVFEVDAASDSFFEGSVYWLPIQAKQCEAICFDGDELLIANEQRDLYRVPLSDLIKVK